jgi:LPS export ABC transporter protein LptC
MIYFLFEPMNLDKTDTKEMPQFSLEKFTMYELDQNGLTAKMLGDDGLKYSDRYVVKNIDYTDNSKEFKTNMKALDGLYKKDILYLKGDVELKRDDGLNFFSQKLTYNKLKDTAHTDVKYIAYMGKNFVTGSRAKIDNRAGKIRSKKIYAVYNLERE